MIEITVGICEAFKAIGVDISEADLKKFEQALYERHLNVAPRRGDKPEFFWSPPDGAPIVGITTYEGLVVVATASGVYTINDRHRVLDDWVVQKVSAAVRQS